MKEHAQEYGVRRWAGDDLIELQGEPLAAIQKTVEPYAPCILQGCEVDEAAKRITAGYVALWETDEKNEKTEVKIARFEGCKYEKLPVYLFLKKTEERRRYVDGNNKIVAYDYTADQNTVYEDVKDKFPLEISETSCNRLPENLTVNFAAAKERDNIQPKETIGTAFGKIKKWLGDLKALAFKERVAKGDLADELADELNGKVDKVKDYGLSKNDFTDALKERLNSIEPGANKTIVDSTFISESDNPVQNKVVKAALDDKLSLSGGTITGNLRLKGSGNYGNKLNFGDGDNVYLSEPTDNNLEIQGTNGINLKTNAGLDTVKVNGTPIKEAIGAPLNGFSIYRLNSSWSSSTASIAMETYFTASVLNGRPLQVGDLFIEASANSYLYRVTAISGGIVTGTRLISLRGATGATGAAGATGAKGDKGDKGDTGAAGATGATGARGMQGLEGLGIWRSTTATGTGTTSITLSTITIPTGRSVKIGDLIIANSTYSYLYRVTAVSLTTATVAYLTSLRGATGANATTTAVATKSSNGLMSAADKTNLEYLFGWRIMGIYHFKANGLNYGWGPTIGVNQDTANTCFSITLSGNEFLTTGNYQPFAFGGKGHTAEAEVTNVHGGGVFKVFHRKASDGKAEFADGLRMIIFQLNA